MINRTIGEKPLYHSVVLDCTWHRWRTRRPDPLRILDRLEKGIRNLEGGRGGGKTLLVKIRDDRAVADNS